MNNAFENDFNVAINYYAWSTMPGTCEENYSDKKHRVYVGRASKLYELMKEKDAPNDELLAAWTYLMICVKAKELHLNMDKAMKQFNIKELERRYVK